LGKGLLVWYGKAATTLRKGGSCGGVGGSWNPTWVNLETRSIARNM